MCLSLYVYKVLFCCFCLHFRSVFIGLTRFHWRSLLTWTLSNPSLDLRKPFHSQECYRKFKTEEKSWISFCQIVKNKQYHIKLLLDSFHLNGHTLGFYPQTQKVQPHLLTQGLTLGVKGLKTLSKSTHKWKVSTGYLSLSRNTTGVRLGMESRWFVQHFEFYLLLLPLCYSS